MALLEVEDLGIGFPIGGRIVEVVRGLSFSVDAGEAVGLVGESGSGKSQTALAILRLIRPPGRITRARSMPPRVGRVASVMEATSGAGPVRRSADMDSNTARLSASD
jgi:ABC-type glutathione transport system ATPase component